MSKSPKHNNGNTKIQNSNQQIMHNNQHTTKYEFVCSTWKFTWISHNHKQELITHNHDQKEKKLYKGKDPSLPFMHLTLIIRVIICPYLIFQQASKPSRQWNLTIPQTLDFLFSPKALSPKFHVL